MSVSENHCGCIGFLELYIMLQTSLLALFRPTVIVTDGFTLSCRQAYVNLSSCSSINCCT